jgi:hypothetical protein
METAGPASGEASCEESREEKNRTEPFFSTYQWQWWVISPNSIGFGVGGAPPEVLHKNHGVGVYTLFLEQIRGVGMFG